MRPGRIDKTIFIGLPDKKSREAILKIHSFGKPRDKQIKFEDLVEITENFSGAQIENLLNEAMLNALKLNKTYFNQSDLEIVMNKILSGFQEMKHEFTSDMVMQVAIHEMGHAMVSVFSKHHSKASKVVINLSSPKSFGYTVFNKLSNSVLLSREVLFEHLMILLGGRVAEEVFYNVSVTIGAREDFQAALTMAYDMVINYGMGSELVYPRNSEKYKQLIDDDVLKLMKNAYKYSKQIILSNKELIYDLSLMLQKDKVLKLEDITQFMREKNDYNAMMDSTVEVPFLELLDD
jgi:cell division protease FtsH